MQIMDQGITASAEIAVRNGLNGCSCSEAILFTYAPRFGLTKSTALKAAAGLAGGVGLAGQTCGVVTASVIVLGLVNGPDTMADVQGRRQAMIQASCFVDEFERIHGSLLCSKLCAGLDMRTPEGAKAIRHSGIPEKLIRSAGEILDSMLNNTVML